MMPLHFSATRKEKFDRCKRLWWLTEIKNIKEPDRGYFTFGTALHAVIERYLKADETEQSLDLYPEGWDKEITKGESALIKELIQKAIDQGIIARLPGQLVEYKFTEELIPGEVFFTSTIDLLTEEGIEDHKTTKAMKWAKSPEALRKNGQLLMYAMKYLDRKHERGEPFPTKIRLTHNVFCKDPNDKRVRQTVAYVTPQEVIDYWQTVLSETIPEMLLVREAKTWDNIPPPENTSEACNAYGGCTFRGLCGGHESFETLTRRLAPKPPPTPTKKDTPFMSLMDRIKQGQPNQPNQPNRPLSINPVLPSKAQAIEVRAMRASTIGQPPPKPPPPESDREAPPWAIGSCQACDGVGFNSKGSPCRICDNSRAQAKGIQSDMFALSTTKEGEITWKPKKEWLIQLQQLGYEEVGEGSYDATGDEDVEVEYDEDQPDAVQAPEPAAPLLAPRRGPGRPKKPTPAPEIEEEEADPEPVPVPDEDEEAEEDFRLSEPEPKRGRGRPRKPEVLGTIERSAFIMFMGCRRQAGMSNPISMEEIVQKIGQELADELKIPTMYDMDVWKRRDALGSAAKEVARRMGGKTVIVEMITRENQGLVEGLMARAKDVFVADGFFTRIA